MEDDLVPEGRTAFVKVNEVLILVVVEDDLVLTREATPDEIRMRS